VVEYGVTSGDLAHALPTQQLRILARLRGGDTVFRMSRALLRCPFWLYSRRHLLIDRRLDAAFRAFGLTSSSQKVGTLLPSGSARAGTDLWHADHVAHCHADRGPFGLLITLFLTELSPQWLRRPIGIAIELLAGISEHHLRHLGTVRVRSVPATTRSAVLDDFLGCVPGISSFAGRCVAVPPGATFHRTALWHRHADCGAHPRHHGSAVRHFDFPRRVRGGSSSSQGAAYGVGCTTGKWSAMSFCPIRASA